MPNQTEADQSLKKLKKRVHDFYCDETSDNVRTMTGKQNCVSVGNNEGKKNYEQNMLLLRNTEELYALYQEKYPDDKIGVSSFFMLRPKRCKLAGASGTHSVCICAIHRNFDLLLRASKTDLIYQDIIPKIVCSEESRGVC